MTDKKKANAKKQQFSFEVCIVRSVIVTVEATTEIEALEIAESGDWVDEKYCGMKDFEIRGRVR